MFLRNIGGLSQPPAEKSEFWSPRSYSLVLPAWRKEKNPIQKFKITCYIKIIFHTHINFLIKITITILDIKLDDSHCIILVIHWFCPAWRKEKIQIKNPKLHVTSKPFFILVINFGTQQRNPRELGGIDKILIILPSHTMGGVIYNEDAEYKLTNF